jgi:hypothetical protein
MREISESEREIYDKYPALGEVMSDSSLTPHQRKLRSLPIFKNLQNELVADIAQHSAALVEAKQERARLGGIVDASESLAEWLNVTPTLEKNDCSRLHKLIAAFAADQVVFLGEAKGQDDRSKRMQTALLFGDCHPFVVQHDWAAAFDGATDYAEGEFKLPYPICVFEFRISGRNVIVWAAQQEDDPAVIDLAALAFVDVNGTWFCREEKGRDEEATKFAWQQIRAICIALDAEVATHSVIRAPHKLNRRRQEDGKCPLFDYRVVSLARRVRAIGPSMGGAIQGKKRLHFRRGHWRHYAEFKTWVRWTLVGNPDLGFIHQEYRL